MHKKSTIITLLVVFVALATYPFWSQVGGDFDGINPELPANYTECVESREYMRSNHMKLLHEWRDEVVREGKRTYVNSQGKEFNKSLTNTCMKCHNNKERFCDTCHKAAGVDNYCWDCHHTRPVLEGGDEIMHGMHNAPHGGIPKPAEEMPK